MMYLGADHRGFALKEKAKKWLSEFGYQYEDMGAFEYNKDDDYPDFAQSVAQRVAEDPQSRGILICGSGVGVAIAANKVKGIRAGTAINAKQIKDSVGDEDTNIVAISADYILEDEAKEIIKSFVEAKFSKAERHVRRIAKFEDANG